MRSAIPLAFALFLPSLQVQAIDLEELEAIREEAENMTEVEQIIIDGTKNEQIKVFQAAMDDDDAVLRSRAMELALNSDNQTLKTEAFREIFRNRDKLLIDVGLPDNPSPTQNWLYQRWKGLVLQSLELSENGNEVSGIFHTSEYKYNSGEGNYTGQIVSGGIRMEMVPGRNKTHTCILITGEVTGTEISGTLDCLLKQKTQTGKYSFEGRKEKATLPIMIRLS